MLNKKLFVSSFVHDTVVDGPGIRTSIYLSGCSHFCKNCHNPQTWNEKNGKELSIFEIIGEFEKDPLDYGITISGGDPFYNPQNLYILLKMLKVTFPNKNILVYTGYYLNQLNDDIHKKCLNLIDILIDGPFEVQNLDLSLKFRGSSNQKIYYLKEKK